MGRLKRLFKQFVIVGLLAVSGCNSDKKQESGKSDPVTLPNPAAKFCVEQGGEYILASGECKLANSKVVDAWEHFREHELTQKK